MLTDILVPPATRQARPVLNFEEARTLGERHGTPLLVVSQSRLVETFETMRNHLPGVELFYAAKANPNQHVLKTLCDSGSSVDVCSFGEMQAALEAGFTPDRMIHTHPCKTESNLIDCYNAGLRWFVYDNDHELSKIAQYSPDVNLILRLAMSAGSSLINLSAKFGAAPTDAIDLMLAARRRGLNVRAISFHVGSQCVNPNDYRTAFQRVRQIWDEASRLGFELEMLDIGGGFPAPYRNDSLMTLADFCRNVHRSLNECFGDLGIRLAAEPGRGLCAESVTLVTRILGKSFRGGRTWYIIDDGLYGSFSGKVFDHMEYDLIAENPFDLPVEPCVVAGPTCDSSDVVCRDQLLPDMSIGDILLVPTMGAYTNASACPFNGLPVAKCIKID